MFVCLFSTWAYISKQGKPLFPQQVSNSKLDMVGKGLRSCTFSQAVPKVGVVPLCNDSERP